MKKFARSCWLLVITLCTTLPVLADSTMYSNFNSDPNNLYDTHEGYAINGTGAGFYQAIAEGFVSGFSGSVTQIDVALGYDFGANSFDIGLYTDNNGGLGTHLGEWDDLASPENFGGCCGVITISGITGINLTSNESYFLVLEPSDPNGTTAGAWMYNNTGASGLLLGSSDGGNTWINDGVMPSGAFDIRGNPSGTTPEPPSLILFGSGLMGAFATKRLKF